MKPQDIVVLLKKLTTSGRLLSNNQLASSLGMSASSVCACIKRCRMAQLVDEKKKRVNVLALQEFLVHGLRYAFPVVPGRIVRGVATYISASPIKEQVVAGQEHFVWPSPHGILRGQKIEPLYPSVPFAISKDDELYRLLVIVDTLRIGRVREREIAEKELSVQLQRYGEDEH